MGHPLFYTKRHFGKLIHSNTTNTSWVGTIPAPFLYDSLLDLSVIHDMISDELLLHDNNVDVVGFWNPDIYRNLPTILSEENPGLWELLEYVLVSIGERYEDMDRIHSLVFFKPFYGLAFVARPHVVQSFMEWLSRITIFIFSDPKALSLLRNQQLQPQPRSPQSVFSTLGERLAPYFMNTRDFHIIQSPQEYQEYVHNREKLLKCQSQRSMIPPGLGEMYEVFIYYHIGMVNNWRDIVLEQLEKLEVCGLGYIANGITITFSNPSPDHSTVSSTRDIRALLYQYDFAIRLSGNVSILDASTTNPYEAMIMESMSSFCRENQETTNRSESRKKQILFYFHDKGCSRYTETDEAQGYEYMNVKYWRLYMEAFLLERPSLCIRAILNYDAHTCGVNLQTYPYLHYSGNFWATSCDYIVGLPPTRDKWRPNDKGFIDLWYEKIGPELWIGNFSDRPDGEANRHLSLFNIANDLYVTPAEYTIYLWIFDNVSLCASGERNSTVSLGDHYPVDVFVTKNISDLWKEYDNSKV
jgi:hypothetical protein